MKQTLVSCNSGREGWIRPQDQRVEWLEDWGRAGWNGRSPKLEQPEMRWGVGGGGEYEGWSRVGAGPRPLPIKFGSRLVGFDEGRGGGGGGGGG